MGESGLDRIQREYAEGQRLRNERVRQERRAIRLRETADFLRGFVLPAAITCALTALADATMKLGASSNGDLIRNLLMAFLATATAAGGLQYYATRPYVKNPPTTAFEYAVGTFFTGLYVWAAAWLLYFVGAIAVAFAGRLIGLW